MAKQRQLNVRVDDHELALLRRLSETYGVSVGAVVRLLIRQAGSDGVTLPAVRPAGLRRKGRT